MNFSHLDSEQTRREAFPVCAEWIFLAHAGVAPLPAVAADALRSFAQTASTENQETPSSWEVVRDTRRGAAELLGCKPGEISLVGPTAVGLSLVALGLDWQEGDEVVYYPHDYPANVYPWMNLATRGVRPVPLRTSQAGRIGWEDVERCLTPNTRLVSLASCHYLTGWRPDVEDIGRRLRERGVLFCVDGIQTLGAFPLSVANVDFLAADSHKWMLGPVGAGIFYVRREAQQKLRPALLGAWNVQSPDFIAQPRMELEGGGRRYEPGTLNLPGIAGMHASLRMLLAVGIDRVAARIIRLRESLVEAGLGCGLRLVSPSIRDAGPDFDPRAGIVTFELPPDRKEEVTHALQSARIVFSVRKHVEGPWCLRFSPHFYNTEAEIARTGEVMHSVIQ